MLNLLHPKNTTEVSSFDSCLIIEIVVCVICVVWLVSVLDVVITIFSVVSIEVVSFLVKEVVSISLGVVVEIIVDTISDKSWFLVREIVSIALWIVVATSVKGWVSFTKVVGIVGTGISVHTLLSSIIQMKPAIKLAVQLSLHFIATN